MRKMLSMALGGLISISVACGSSSSTSGTGGGSGATGGGGGADAGTEAPVVANCSGFCSKAGAANCGDVDTSCASDCQTVVNSSPACSDIQARFFNCVADANQAQIQCQGGVTVAPTCEPIAELTGVNGCASAVNNVDCYGATCKFDSDCGSVATFSCNTKTGRCIKRATACRGLPCKFDSDCGDLTAWVCNSSLRVCVAK